MDENRNEYGGYTGSSGDTGSSYSENKSESVNTGDSQNTGSTTGSRYYTQSTENTTGTSYSSQSTGSTTGTGYSSYNTGSTTGSGYNYQRTGNPTGTGYSSQTGTYGTGNSYGGRYSTGYPNVGSSGNNNANRYADYKFADNGNSHIPNNPMNHNGSGMPKKRVPFWKKALAAVALGLVFGAFAGAGLFAVNLITGHGNNNNEQTVQETVPEKEDSSVASTTISANTADGQVSGTTTTTSAVTFGSMDVSGVASNVMPAVVAITNEYTQTVQDFWGQQYSKNGEAAGSGIIVGDNGTELLIVTNEHVVSKADSLGVQFDDGTSAEANIKGEDESADIAVIAVDKSSLSSDTLSAIKVATLGDSDSLKVGQQVVAIGNALGYGQSVTTGIVSAVNRELTLENGTHKLIQTDAAINPGNSGGALLDMNGNLIGINEAKLASDEVEGMGYAIPISTAKPIIEQLMNKSTKKKASEEERGYLGIAGRDVTSEISEQYSMPRGVYIAKVYKDTGAESAGLQEKDIITSLDGQTIQSMEQLQELLTYYKAGDTVEVVVQEPNSDNYGYTEKTYSVVLSTSTGDAGNTSGSQGQSKQNINPNMPGQEQDGQSEGNQNEGNQNDESQYGGNSLYDIFGNLW